MGVFLWNFTFKVTVGHLFGAEGSIQNITSSGRRKADWDNDLGIVKSKMKIVKVPGEHEIV